MLVSCMEPFCFSHVFLCHKLYRFLPVEIQSDIDDIFIIMSTLLVTSVQFLNCFQ